MLGLAWELEPHIRPNRYYIVGEPQKVIPTKNSLSLLQPSFQLFWSWGI